MKEHRGTRGLALLFLKPGCWMWVGGQRHAPTALSPPAISRYPLYRRLDGPQDWSGLMRKISPPPPRFDPGILNSAASRHTDCFWIGKWYKVCLHSHWTECRVVMLGAYFILGKTVTSSILGPEAWNDFTHYLQTTAVAVSQGGSGQFFLILAHPSITTCHATVYKRTTSFQNEIKTKHSFHSCQSNASLLCLIHKQHKRFSMNTYAYSVRKFYISWFSKQFRRT
jgi:hypothetical protein